MSDEITSPNPMLTIRADLMQTPEPGRLEITRGAVIAVEATGVIVSVEVDADRPVDVTLPDGDWLLPGLIDTHIHAPQWPQLGTGLDLPLEDWLNRYTFPLEARYADLDFAADVWTIMVDTLLAHGTTTGVYYGTVDVAATTLLASVCADRGQRALVGRVAMDHPDGTPPFYRDADAEAAVAASATSIDQIRALGTDLVEPIVTPRFVPACTDGALTGLGRLAAETGTTVQTHCSESDWEHGAVRARTGRSDTEALERWGLIAPHAVLAHGTLMSDDDLRRSAAAGAGVAHCPLSNAYFGDAVFPFARALGLGVAVGLGSDLAGGAAPGMFRQCQEAVTASRHLEQGVDPALDRDRRRTGHHRIDTATAFWAATAGGARLLGHPTGLLTPGRAFDAIAVTTTRGGSALRVWPELDDDHRAFDKIVALASPADITDVWVAGHRVAGAGRPAAG